MFSALVSPAEKIFFGGREATTGIRLRFAGYLFSQNACVTKSRLLVIGSCMHVVFSSFIGMLSSSLHSHGIEISHFHLVNCIDCGQYVVNASSISQS